MPRKVNSSKGERWHIAKPRITTGTNSWGYKVVQMKKDGIRKMFWLHILVGRVFVENPNNYPQINHKNAIRHDNRADNLEWTNQMQNVHHAMDMGLHWTTNGEDRENAKLTENDVREIRRLYPLGGWSYRKLAAKYSISYSQVEDIIKHKRWKHVQ